MPSRVAPGGGIGNDSLTVLRHLHGAERHLLSGGSRKSQRDSISVTETNRETALDIRHLAKSFVAPAVDGLSLQGRGGEFYTLLGPNGAGKTTTLRMVTGLLKPDRGGIAVFGVDVLANPVAAKQIMAWVSDEPMIYDRLTPLEYLYFVAGLWGVSRS